jgi:hypothetical protein
VKFALAMLASIVVLAGVAIIVAMAVIDVVIDFEEPEDEELDEEYF